MPGYKTHACVGALTFVALFGVLQKIYFLHCGFFTALTYFFVTILGSLFPDVDTKSKGQMIFYQAIVLYLLFLLGSGRFDQFMVLTCVTMIPLLVPHRGLFHRIWFLLMIVVCASIASLYFIPNKAQECVLYLLFFFVGAVSHVLLDRLQTSLKLGLF